MVWGFPFRLRGIADGRRVDRAETVSDAWNEFSVQSQRRPPPTSRPLGPAVCAFATGRPRLAPTARLRGRATDNPTSASRPAGRTAPPTVAEGPLSLDALSEHWRVALDAAQDALRTAGLCGRSLRFTPQERHEWATRLGQERAATARLVDAVAHEEHVHLLHRLSTSRASKRMLGLPSDVLGCVFDLDGVLTASATVHAAAWAETFDEFLTHWAERTGERFAPIPRFNPRDYREHIHGKPRLEGVHAFLASRGIRIPEGHLDDLPSAASVYGIANRKNEALLRRLDREGVTAFEGSQHYLEAARDADLLCAVVSASANTGMILERAGLAALIEQRIDGNTIRTEQLRRKPAPDTLLAACKLLGIPPQKAVAFETTLAGIAAGRAAGFGLVIGVDREGKAAALREHGADRVVRRTSAQRD